ncbi:MAG: hypothetical protein FWH34_04000 [Desulfovibrionaceae bacterium]|nr:hypothetical protein [Desulfovibrionaceae bacterium]MCL2123233.1 hypothetical protein [Desulfovibrionaceae bacterium]
MALSLKRFFKPKRISFFEKIPKQKSPIWLANTIMPKLGKPIIGLFPQKEIFVENNLIYVVLPQKILAVKFPPKKSPSPQKNISQKNILPKNLPALSAIYFCKNRDTPDMHCGQKKIISIKDPQQQIRGWGGGERKNAMPCYCAGA